MLAQLTVENIGLLVTAKLELGPGFNVITGETGVGKSLLLGSLELLAGERVRNDAMRAGCDEARVAGFFRIEDAAVRASISTLLGFEVVDGELLVERRLRASGRHGAYVNGNEVPRALLARLGSLLFEAAGQRSQLALLDPARQLEYLDRFAGIAPRVDEFEALYTEARGLADRIDGIQKAARERHDRRLFITHIVEELERARLVPGERAELERELGLLQERDAIVERIRNTRQSFYDAEGSVVDQLAAAEKEFSAIASLDAALADFVRACGTARSVIEDGLLGLHGVEEGLDQDPKRLAAVERRFDEIARLEDRFHRSADDLIAYFAELKAELGRLVSDDAELPALEEDLRTRLADLGERARELGKERRAAAARLEKLIGRELADLALGGATFDAAVDRQAAGEGWLGLGPRGADRVELRFGPNPGEPVRPLRETASGGELSRVFLALKRVLAGCDHVPILVLDEVDAGVGGRLGVELGRKMREIARTHQVICVTHLPQIASYATRHFHVEKRVVKERTVTLIEELDGDRRIEEVAAMIRGKQRTKTSLAEAREMLLEATK